MINISNGKRLMTMLMKEKDLENKSLLACLEKRNITIDQFILDLGLDPLLLNNPFYDEIMADIKQILALSETIISYNPDLKSIVHDEIAFYNPKTKDHLAFTDKAIKVGKDKTLLENDLVKKTSFWKEIRAMNQGIYKIDFKISYDFGFVNSLYPKDNISNFVLNVLFIYPVNGDYKEITYEIQIPIGLNNHKLREIMEALYHFDAIGVYQSFLNDNLPGLVINDNFYLKNMHKEANR